MNMSTLFGVPVRRSDVPLEREVQVRPHKRRRGQSRAYHERINKKWAKRWGMRKERYSVVMDPRAVGIDGPQEIIMDQRDFAMFFANAK